MRTISYTATTGTDTFAGLAVGSSGIMVVDAVWATQNQVAIRTGTTIEVYTVGVARHGITINTISGF